MANSDANYGNPVNWGNVKKIEVSKQVIEGWFYQMKKIEKEIEHLRISIGIISSEKDKEIERLKADNALLSRQVKKQSGK